MNAKRPTLLLYLLLTGLHAAAADPVGPTVPQPSATTASAPAPAWKHGEIEGWSIRIRPELVEGTNATATEFVLELLRQQLKEILRVVSAPAVRELQRVPLYFSPEYPGRKPTAEYHPDAGWLRANGRDPAMAKAVEFTNVRQFEAEMDRMPNFTLHELAHAYHERVLPQGLAHAEIKAAYEQAKASGRYERVERRFGNGRPNAFERAYAMTDAMEYFAETSEAFFGRNDFFPFTREELAAHDPEIFALLGRLWGQVAEARPAFERRGYYLCFMRMPTFGLPIWREILDGVAEDGVNTVILWMGGAFRSQRYPITWQWARDHENVKSDFGRELIRHAHRRGLQVLLGFTPFGYDGVNQLPLEKPELKALGQDGQTVREFGIGCWGWNLCPAKPESQRFMREYVREMAFEFYPEADGLFIESSRKLTAHPDLPDTELRARLGRELFGTNGDPGQVEDLFFLLQIFNTDRDWAVPGALTAPGLVQSRAEQGRLDSQKRAQLRSQLARVQVMAERYRDTSSPGSKELQRIAQWLVDQWAGAPSDILKAP